MGGWWLLFEPELHLKSDEIVPRTKGLLMAYELLDMAQARWRRLDGADLLPPVRAGILFVDGVQHEGKASRARARAA